MMTFEKKKHIITYAFLEYQETMQEYDQVHQECYKKIVEVVFTLMDTRKGRLGGSWYGNEEENCRKRVMVRMVMDV